MDDLERLVVADAAEASAFSSPASASASIPADLGSKNGQYRLFAMVSHLGKNTTSGEKSSCPRISSLTRLRPLCRAHHERWPVAVVQRREGDADAQSLFVCTPSNPLLKVANSIKPPTQFAYVLAITILNVCYVSMSLTFELQLCILLPPRGLICSTAGGGGMRWYELSENNGNGGHRANCK
jgi:hypothetical protein